MNAIIQKIVLIPAFFSIIFYLSFPVVFSGADCFDDCQCCCDELRNISAGSDCCAAQEAAASVISGVCCFNEQSHIAHFTLPKNHSHQNSPCDFNSFIFNNQNFDILSGVIQEEGISPVDIVNFIFKPPSA